MICLGLLQAGTRMAAPLVDIGYCVLLPSTKARDTLSILMWCYATKLMLRRKSMLHQCYDNDNEGQWLYDEPCQARDLGTSLFLLKEAHPLLMTWEMTNLPYLII